MDLPLYGGALAAPLDAAAPMVLDRGCRMCARGSDSNVTTCLPATGAPGGVLVVGDYASREDDSRGQPFCGDAGRTVRALISARYAGPVAYDTALRCYSKGVDKDKVFSQVVACRGYLAGTYGEVKPERIIVMGAVAASSVLGRHVPILSVRRGFGWTFQDGRHIPVFILQNPTSAMRNRFLRGWFEDDLTWALTAPVPSARHFGGLARMVTSVADALEAETALRAAQWSAFDAEWAGQLYGAPFRLLCGSFCARGAVSAWTWDEAALLNAGTMAVFRRLLEDPEVKLVGQMIKADAGAVWSSHRINMRGIVGDTLYWRSMLDSDAEAKLEVSAELVGMGGHKEEAKRALQVGAAAAVKQYREEKMKQQGFGFWQRNPLCPVVRRGIDEGWETEAWAYATVPTDVLVRYNARDTVSTAQLGVELEGRLELEPDIRRTWDDVVSGAPHAVAMVERWGVPANRSVVDGLARYLEVKQQDVLGRVMQHGVNPDSNPQLADLLFNKFKLPVIKRSEKTKEPSTDKEVLAALRGKHPFIDDLIAWRKLQKMRGTYADGGDAVLGQPFKMGTGGTLQHIRSDGRIHGSLNIDGTSTGRLSMDHPNLQNQPRAKTEMGRMVRDIFCSDPGWWLVEFDYSQLELRVAAALSGDPNMRAIFESGVDYHHRTAQLIARAVWGKDPSEIGPDGFERDVAKTINFALLYGKSDETLAAGLGIPVSTVARIRAAIFGSFPRLAAWSTEVTEQGIRDGFTWTYWNGKRARRRWMTDVAYLSSDDRDDRYKAGSAKRSMINTPVQGSANEYCLKSLIQVVDWIESEGVPAEVSLTVHDSLMLHVREDALVEVAHVVPAIMTSHYSNGVPMLADKKFGKSWGSMQKNMPVAQVC